MSRLTRAQRDEREQAEQQAAYEEHRRRIALVYQVPASAAEKFVELVDVIGEDAATAVAGLIEAMIDAHTASSH